MHVLATLAHLSVLGGGVLAIDQMLQLGSAQSAPQQAAGAAMACAYVIIPYCSARALGEMARHVRNR